MKLKIWLLLILLEMFGLFVVNDRPAARAAGSLQPEPSLRLNEPVAVIVADLVQFIPVYMRQEAIPGVAIAHRALGGPVEPLRRAIHLEFNYGRDGS